METDISDITSLFSRVVITDTPAMDKKIISDTNDLPTETVRSAMRPSEPLVLSSIDAMQASHSVNYKELYEKTSKELQDTLIKLRMYEERTQQCETSMSSTMNMLKTIVERQYELQENKNFWTRSPFSHLNLLKNDYSGKVGEVFIHTLCLNKIDCVYQEDKISKDGIYDIILNGKKIEIKTARIGSNNSFQHENLRKDGSDYYMFVDITPSIVYLTILPHFDLSEKCQITNRKPHLRKGTENVFKFDFSVSNIEKATRMGYSIKIVNTTSEEEIIHFINRIIK